MHELSSLQLLDYVDDSNVRSNCEGFSLLANVHDIEEPKHFKATFFQRQMAMQEEFDSLKAQGTWLLVPSPSDRAIIGSKWVYKVKKNPDGTISKYKARLVAQGFSQEHGLDFSETFSLIVRHTTMRYLLWQHNMVGVLNNWM